MMTGITALLKALTVLIGGSLILGSILFLGCIFATAAIGVYTYRIAKL